ncbi:winged helix-turn-helix domain-containing protein [Thiomicrorhabdus sp. Kp2]|uniref:winged helix-turn-helix domain-containing protein n=1 Tax=Thiomicrorhabdus sp. Kp2 TaxID=1123518 RepID=UPI0003FD24D6|nr:LysR family transcriptional regulator [Thiomicrorhabdus sp. Kp2]
MSQDNEKLPGEPYSKNIRARFWITGDQSGYIGIGRIQLLEKIEQHGSMSQAAKSMGMSYKKAWKLIEELNAMYDEPMIMKLKGGKSGGGSVLTPRGKKIIEDYKLVEQEIEQLLKKLSNRL